MKLWICAAIVFLCSSGKSGVAVEAEKKYYVRLSCAYGSCVIRLYNETPVHRDNFLKLTKSGYFDSTFFHRIIKHFVVQGGDPDSLYAPGNLLRPEQKWLNAELNDSLYHKKGAVAMGRDDNPAKQSFSTQFYFVQGKTWTDAGLDSIQARYHKGRAILPYQRQVYKTIGGLPYLDQRYTVFGEIVEGQQLVDVLSSVTTNSEDVPFKKIKIRIEVWNR